jgi:hypothetical protein
VKNTFVTAAVFAFLGAGIYISLRNNRHPADDPALGSIAKARPVVKSICVSPIQNLSKKPAAMEGVDDELVAQLHKVGFESRKASDGGSQCDAVTNAEVVNITGRGRKTARVDFRLTLTNEQVPRMSSSVEGKSGGKGGDLEKSLDEFAVNQSPKESAGAEREAIVAALTKTASQIDAANKRGLPPWQAKEQ